MKTTDTISVLVCVHSTTPEGDVLLERALTSLAEQTYKDFEIVVVLDECHSTTEIVVGLICIKYGLNLSYFKRDKKEGLAAAKNFGLTKCTGDWIAYLDGDDRYMKCKLEFHREFMLEHSYVDFCGTNAWDVVEDGIMRPNCFKVTDYITHGEIAEALNHENVLCHGSMMIRSVAIQSLNGYNTSRDFLGREDWELWRRAVDAGFTFMKVPERLYVYSLGTSVGR